METLTHDPGLTAKNRKTMRVLLGITVGMFLFGWGAVPFYGMLCRHFGIGPVSAAPAAAGVIPTDEDRFVNLKFMAQVNAGLKAKFGPVEPMIRMKVGEPKSVNWRFQNLSDKPLEFQAIYSVAPDQAGPHLDKIECFCFTRQTLKPFEKRVMPVTLRLDPSMSKKVHEVTLAYTLYAIKPDLESIRDGQAKSIAKHDQTGH